MSRAFAATGPGHTGYGNLLPRNIATGTDELGTTVGFEQANGKNSTLTSSASFAYQGSKSLKVVATTTGIAWATGTGSAYWPSAVAGVTYTMAMQVWSTAALATRFNIEWKNAADATISTAGGAYLPALSTVAWNLVSYTAVAPALTVRARIIYSSQTATVSDALYCDALTFQAGAGTDWATPGATTLWRRGQSGSRRSL